MKETQKESDVISLAEEAFERGFPKFGLNLLEKSETSLSIGKQLKSGLNPKLALKELRDIYESSLSLLKYADSKRLSVNAGELEEYRDGFENYFKPKEKNFGSIAIRLNSPTIMPLQNQRALTETSGTTLIGTELRSDLIELPNPIPTLQKLGITYNFVKGAASKQVIPSVVLNSPGADILDNIIVGDFTDPEFTLYDSMVYLYTTQLELSRKFFNQINETTNEFLKQLIFNVIQDALMYRVFNGVTASGQSLGLSSNTDIEKIAGASFSDTIGYSVMQKVHANQAENCVWVLNSALEKVLKARPYAGGTRMVIEKNLLLDRPFIVSERIASGELYYGAFQSVVLTLFDLELLLDPFSTAGVVIKQWQPYSMTVRNTGWIKCLTGVD